jgi:deoxyribodipyrimidine photo-lyase
MDRMARSRARPPEDEMIEREAFLSREPVRKGRCVLYWMQASQRAVENPALDAAMIVCDCGYLRHQRRWRARVAKESPCAVVQVESDVVVPMAAVGRRAPRPKRDSLGISVPGAVDGLDDALLESLALDRSVSPVAGARGGTSRALALLHSFIEEKLPFYADERNDPGLETQSGLSPYLHFGQVSPITIARAVRRASGVSEAARVAFLEQLIVRRELSMNFVAHTAAYDSFACLPAWARATLAAHARDARPHQYSARQLEEGRTHDPYWNAAMSEMRLTGRLHGYMRMYWGKKIIEWSPSPAAAFRSALRLNNRYFLDGRDPNSYAGVAWCFGLHDRPWQQRPIFGMVRYMNESGLRRKFDIEGYVRRIEGLGKERS